MSNAPKPWSAEWMRKAFTPLHMPQGEIDLWNARLAAAAKIRRRSALFDFLESLAQMTDDQVALLAGEAGVEQAALQRLSVLARDLKSVDVALLGPRDDESCPQGLQHVGAGEDQRVSAELGRVVGHTADTLATPGAAQ